MPLNLADLFGGGFRERNARVAGADAERQALRQVGAGMSSTGVNPAARSRALSSAQTEQRGAMASRIAAARSADEQARGQAIQGLVGTGLGIAGQVGGMLMGGGGGQQAAGALTGALGGAMKGAQGGDAGQAVLGGLQGALGGAMGGPAASMQAAPVIPSVTQSAPQDLPPPVSLGQQNIPERQGPPGPQLQGVQPRVSPDLNVGRPNEQFAGQPVGPPPPRGIEQPVARPGEAMGDPSNPTFSPQTSTEMDAIRQQLWRLTGLQHGADLPGR